MSFYAPRARRFHDLARYRIREILLVSSPYDAFILEEDGQLSEQVFFEFREISLSAPPRVTHVSSGEQAIQAMEDHRYDLILVMTSLADMGVNVLGHKVKKLRPGRPVIFLALDDRELSEAQDSIDPEAIDRVFLWSGDAQILLAIVKFVEDRQNVDHDVRQGNVRVIIMIEDSPRYYSSFLGILYRELVLQARSLYSEGVNELQRRMHMRSRPKVLHATSYEEGVQLFRRYQNNVLAVVCDVRIPRAGELDAEAGLDFVRLARQQEPELPVLLQSAEAANEERATEIGAAFVDKASPDLLAQLRTFMRESLGFGDFVFRTPDGEDLDRAVDLREFEEKLHRIPEESFAYHAAHNHFSLWLMARSEFELADRLRPKKISDFPSVAATRRYLIEALRETQRTTQRGIVTDLSHTHFDRDFFSRIGQGSLGGKARGIAFLNSRLASMTPADFGGLPVKVPKTVVITTDYFDEFVGANDLRELAYSADSDEPVNRAFLEAPLPEELRQELHFLIGRLSLPLAVRSSSLLEDSMHQPFAGVYTTLMLPNQADSDTQRLEELCAAVKLVYASTFSQRARAYLESTGNRPEEEKMAVILQPVVGSAHAQRFYPTFAGLAQSYNFYPIGPQKPTDGIVHLALGLGRTVVEGGNALRFSPRHPGVLPQISSPRTFVDITQRSFYALDLERKSWEAPDLFDTVKRFDLGAAEADGSLAIVGSVFSRDEESIRDDLSIAGPRVVTFNNILKYDAIPLARAINRLLVEARRGLGNPVEIEFACDMGDWGSLTRSESRREPVLYALQMRPYGPRTTPLVTSHLRFAEEDILCRSDQSLGHGVERDIADLVYVFRETWDPADNREIARQIGELNARLREQGRPYILIGPGRWGSTDHWLGIPVQWTQIDGVKLIIEVSPQDHPVEPSQGTHFFHNIVSLRIGYVTLPPGGSSGRNGSHLDWEWLEAQPVEERSGHLVHVRLAEPVTVVLDGRDGQAVIAKPGARVVA